MITRAIDSSFDLLTVEEARCFGIHTLFVQCLLALPTSGPMQPSTRIQSLRNARTAGLPIAGYALVGGGMPGKSYINMARGGVPDEIWDKLKFVAIDVETQGVTISEILKAVDQVEALGKKALYYTNRNSHLNYVTPSNSTHLAERGVPLWNAYWDGHPDTDFSEWPFGGWRASQVALEQWSGGTTECGQFVDRNSVPNPQLFDTEEHMPTPEYEELKAALRTKASNRAVWDLAVRLKMLTDTVNGQTCALQRAYQVIEGISPQRALKEVVDELLRARKASEPSYIELSNILTELEALNAPS